MSLDDDLSTLLARRQPREGFAERVVARAWAERRRRHTRRRWAGALAAGLAAAGLALSPVFDHLVERRRAAEAERARDQLLLALSITSEKLSTVSRTLRDRDASPAEPPRRGGPR